MTTWTELDDGDRSRRDVAHLRCVVQKRSDDDFQWVVWDRGHAGCNGNCPDLASAQAAADAAVEAIHAAMGKDLWLVFGVPREVGFGGVDRYAIASDGRLYTVSTQRVDGVVVKVRWFTQSDTEFGAEGVCATVEDAIAAARAHDAARRGQR